MNGGPLTSVVGFFRRLIGSAATSGLTDGHLLEQFADRRDEAAFATLLDRHGSMVFGVCRRVLHHAQDAEDAFQATFLVLARKAASLTGQASLAGWLSTVAYRIALKLRAGAARLREVEEQCDVWPARGEFDDVVWRDLRHVLDEELSRLPEKYRVPILLCYLEGKTNEEAAQQLGWTKGTVSGRLARARDLLRSRLVRRGVTLSASGLGTVLGQQALANAMPPLLPRGAVQNALSTAAGGTAPSVSVARLADGMIKQMTHARTKVIAAWSLLGCMAIAGAMLVFKLFSTQPAVDEETPPPVRPAITVMANYPGADARVVADTVAAPIEQQLQGMENMLHMVSRCDNDGTYALTITFKPGVDLDAARQEVSKRVNLALPVLPDLVKRNGVIVKKKSPGVAVLVTLYSPDASRDGLQLSNYAAIYLKDKFAGLAGVADVASLGLQDYSMRVWLNPEKMAARNLTAADVVKALQDQNKQAAAGQIGQPPAPTGQAFQFPLTTLVRLAEAEQFGDIIVKTSPDGRAVRVRDVGQIKPGSDSISSAQFNGKPAVVLAVFPTPEANPREVVTLVRNLAQTLREGLPKGLRLDIPFDFSTPGAPEYLALEARLRDGTSHERVMAFLTRCETALREIDGVNDTLSLTDNPFDLVRDQPSILVRLAPATQRGKNREQIAQFVRAELEKLPDAVVWLQDYAIEFALHGPELPELNHRVDRMHQQLQKSEKLTDLSARRSTGYPQVHVDVDRDNLQRFGVSREVVDQTLQVYLGSLYVDDFNRFGRTWNVQIQPDEGVRLDPNSALKQARVRNAQGDLVPLCQVIKTREVIAGVVERLNGEPMVRITANLAAGTTLAEARTLCEQLAKDLPKGCRLTWLQEVTPAR